MSNIIPDSGGAGGGACLRVPAELWLKIFGKFYQPDYNKTAAALARTCRALHEQAIPILYGRHIELYSKSTKFLNTVVNNPGIGARIKSLKIVDDGSRDIRTPRLRVPRPLTESTEAKVRRKLRGVQDRRFPKKVMRALTIQLKAGNPSVAAACVLFYTPNLRHLSIDGPTYECEYSPSLWSVAIPSLGKLESVKFRWLSILDAASFLSIPSLRTFHSDGMGGHDIESSQALTRYKDGWNSLEHYQPTINLNLVTSLCIRYITDDIPDNWGYEHMLRRCGNLKRLEMSAKEHEVDHGDTEVPTDSFNSHRIIEALLDPSSSATILESLTIATQRHEGPSCAPLLKRLINLKELSLPSKAIADPCGKLDESLFFQLPNTLHTLAIWHVKDYEWLNFYRPSGAFDKLKALRSTGTQVAESLSSIFLFHSFNVTDLGWEALEALEEDSYSTGKWRESSPIRTRHWNQLTHAPIRDNLLGAGYDRVTKHLEAVGRDLNMGIFMALESMAYDIVRNGRNRRRSSEEVD